MLWLEAKHQLGNILYLTEQKSSPDAEKKNLAVHTLLAKNEQNEALSPKHELVLHLKLVHWCVTHEDEI